MNGNPLHVSFLWHMHQPSYKDPQTGLYRMPWVRLHGVKDYLDMVEILESFPSIHQTFNLVPCLIEQIIDYSQHGGNDRELELSRIPASSLNHQEKLQVLRSFFIGREETMIEPLPRYRELLEKRGREDTLKERLYDFSTQDFLDLQVLFNLSWIDPRFRRETELSKLVQKGRGFTEGDKQKVLEEQMAILRSIVPTYREFQRRGQIEIAVSPYYHPILPLLCDINVATVALPGLQLPRRDFSYPEDAAAQISASFEFCQQVFGTSPRGMWPSEGSVSQAIVPLVVDGGFRWLISDEDILSLSLGYPLRRNLLGKSISLDLLYKPYIVEVQGRELVVLFRDRELANKIDYVYPQWDPQRAAKDFLDHLIDIRGRLVKTSTIEGHLVSIVMDGENCWERYTNDGLEFLECLYRGISDCIQVKTVTVSEHLEHYPAQKRLPRLFPGSWINHNFGIWIGHPQDNRAWELLRNTRDDLLAWQKTHAQEREILEAAWRCIFRAEGSDWCWWYGEEHKTPLIDEFDRLFRGHLSRVYELISAEIPQTLLRPVSRLGQD